MSDKLMNLVLHEWEAMRNHSLARVVGSCHSMVHTYALAFYFKLIKYNKKKKPIVGFFKHVVSLGN